MSKLNSKEICAAHAELDASYAELEEAYEEVEITIDDAIAAEMEKVQND